MGRLVIYYHLTTAGENMFPKNYDAIIMDFLSDIEAIRGECESEWNLFKFVLGTDNVKRVECIAKGGNACKYLVKKS